MLSGTADKVSREFVYEGNFPKETSEEKAFVENLWARRKVGYLLDQIRANGEKKELKDEVIALAKKHGITTPYTSYLVVPEPNAPVASWRTLQDTGTMGGESVIRTDSGLSHLTSPAH